MTAPARPDDPDVWYVGSGSIMCAVRLAAYLEGGSPPGAHDTRAPREAIAVDLSGRICFAQVDTVGRDRVGQRSST